MRHLLPLLFTLIAGTLGNATDITQLAEFIDQQIAQRWASEGIEPAPLVDDHRFICRVTLDLAGRVPTVAEYQAFMQSQEESKRQILVRQLMESPDFAFHQRNEIDTLLLRRLEHNNDWREYLLEAVQQNRGWDRMFREIMLPEQVCPDDVRPASFLRKRIRDLDSLTNDTSILWFGVNVSCAKCHDHPLVYDWTQAHYYGMASFFKRTFATKKGMLGERFDGGLKYTTVDGDKLDADFMFLTGTHVKEPQSDIEDSQLKEFREAIKKSEREESAEPPPQPPFQPRAEFVEVALNETDNRFFAKNIVNRVWARLLGRGLVHPLDQMHSENPASHPALLNQLGEDLAQHDYDLKRLVHAIVLSETYGRCTAAATNSYPPELFAAAVPRPLSPHQLSLSCRIATSSPEQMRGLADPEGWTEQRASLEKQSDGYARQFEIPDDDFQVSVGEALWFSNNASVQNGLLGTGRDKLVGYLAARQSDGEIADAAMRSILSRVATDNELSTLTEYLSQRHDRRVEAIQHIVWALLSSPEFRFNH